MTKSLVVGIGEQLANRYQILKKIGSGGMGDVYLAYDPLLEREVAIKLIQANVLDALIAERFKREARVVAKMDHSSIVPVYDTGTHNNCMFIVMPFVQGTTLRTLIDEKSLTFPEIITIGVQVAEALAYSHAQQVIHRDIKPENIMITKEETIRARVMDFGLAMTTSEKRITDSGLVMGTLCYLSPEQVTGMSIDGRTDIYALATVLYECFAGETPFSGEVYALLYSIAHKAPPPLQSVRYDVPISLERVILKCLEKNPDHRLQSSKELAKELESFLSIKEKSQQHVLTMRFSLPKAPTYQQNTNFIGREREFSQLQHKLTVAATGECQFIVVAGEPGIGKTRLLNELENIAKFKDIPVLHGHFVEQDQTFAYQGFCEVIQEYLRSKITSNLSSLSGFSDLFIDLVSLFPVLSESVKTEVSSSQFSNVSLSKETKRFDDRAYIFDLLARSFIRISEGKPLVILIEGLHGADASIDALQYIVRRLASTPLLIVATYRTTEVNKSHPVIKMLRNFEDDRRFLSIILQPLSFVEQRSLLTDLTYNPELDDQVINKLYQITEGNPYFTKEIIYNLVDSGVFVKDELGCLQLTRDLPLNTEALPQTIQQTVENRICRLPIDLQEALSLMSIIGKTFELKDLEMIFEPDVNIDEIIEQLLEYGLIIEERKSREEKYSFVSAIVCDVVYTNLLPRRKRKSLHKKYAEKLEKRYATRLERVYPQLVHHYSQADIPSKVVSHALNLAKISLNSLSAEDTLRAGKTALDFLDEQTDTLLEAEIRLLLAEAYRLQVNTHEALKELSLAIKICERENQLAKIVQITVLAAEIAWEGRKIDQTMLWIEKGLKVAQEISDFDNLRKLLSLAAMVANLRGDYERAKEYLEEAEKIQPTKIELDKDIIEGGKLIVALPSQIQATCPIEIRFNVEKEVFANIFETLLTIDSRGNLSPHLCERWDSLEENKSFLFTLRANIQLHNNLMLSATEIKQAFQQAIKQASNLPPAFAQILGVSEYLSGHSENLIGIEVISENKLKIQLQEPSSTYPMLLTDLRTAIVYLEENSLSPFNLMGTGPFKILSLTNDYVVVEKFSNYWKNHKALLNRIEFRCGITSADITTGFKTGDYDLACGLLPEDLEALQLDRRLRINTIVTPRKYTGFVLFNSSSSFFSNKQVREILYKITNVQALIWNVLGRFAQPAEGLLPPGICGHDPGRRHQLLSQDKALETLEKLGYQSPISLKAIISPSLRKRYHTLIQTLFEIWAKIGIEILVEPLTFFLDVAEEAPEIDLIIEGQIAEYDDPKAFTSDLFHSKTGIFRNYYSSLELDELIEQANIETKALKKEKLYRKIEDFLLEGFALLPLFHEIDYRVASPNVKGLSLNSIPPYINYSEIGKTGDAPAAIRKKGGGIMYIPYDRDFHSLDPSLVYSDLQGEVIPNIFETLARQSEGGRIIPWLASEIKSEANGKRFRFYLREYIHFHNGRQLTARDVRYSFERLLQNEESQSRLLLSPILGASALINGEKRELEGFKIVSAFEFTIDLAYPISFFPSLVAYAPASIVPEGTEIIDGGWRDSCVGTGPFRVIRFNPRHRLELEANPNYWRRGYPKSDGLVFTFGISQDDILAGFQNGQFSIVGSLLPLGIETLRNNREFVTGYREMPSFSSFFIAFNINQGPLVNEKLRRKLTQLIDINNLLRKHIGRRAIKAHGLIPPGLLGYEKIFHQPLVENKTKFLVEHIELTCTIPPSFLQGAYGVFYNALFNLLRNEGFSITITSKTWDEFLKAQADASVDLSITGWIADYPDADAFIYGVLHSEHGNVGRFCGNKEIDLLIEKGRTESDPVIRHSIYREIEETIERHALLLPLFHPQACRFARPEIEGFELNPFAPFVAYDKLWTRL